MWRDMIRRTVPTWITSPFWLQHGSFEPPWARISWAGICSAGSCMAPAFRWWWPWSARWPPASLAPGSASSPATWAAGGTRSSCAITDAWLTLPSLVFAILLSSVRGPGVWNVVLILTLVFWSRYAARRCAARSWHLRERDFVKLAEINGDQQDAGSSARHIIPNVMNTVMVLFSLQVGVAVIIEASAQLSRRRGAAAGALLGSHDGPGARRP